MRNNEPIRGFFFVAKEQEANQLRRVGLRVHTNARHTVKRGAVTRGLGFARLAHLDQRAPWKRGEM